MLAPMTSISAEDLHATGTPQVVGPNQDIPLNPGARAMECQHFELTEQGQQKKVDQGVVHLAAVEDTHKGPQVTFYLNDFLPADFTATVVQLDGTKSLDEATAPAVRRLVVREAQLQENYLKIEGQDRTFIGDFYTLSPDEGQATVVIPAQDATTFRFDEQTVAGLVAGDRISRCHLPATPGEPAPQEPTPEEPPADEPPAADAAENVEPPAETPEPPAEEAAPEE
ncbi:hypothetical protein C1Y63_10080 [Corynebacterium sp. 13CS0277]|nr:hypothetical protein C1Y63_10080 [Corynebacterium sp. 13CS0277]